MISLQGRWCGSSVWAGVHSHARINDVPAELCTECAAMINAIDSDRPCHWRLHGDLTTLFSGQALWSRSFLVSTVPWGKCSTSLFYWSLLLSSFCAVGGENLFFFFFPWQTLPDVAKITFLGCRRMNHNKKREKERKRKKKPTSYVSHKFEEENLFYFVSSNVGWKEWSKQTF